MKITNVYCDESCHLENDGQKCMVLGCLIVDKDHAFLASNEIKVIKEKWGVSRYTEIKWTKAAPNKLGLYTDIVNYFLSNSHLRFRAVIVPDKQTLIHDFFDQTNDEFYYKIFYIALQPILNNTDYFKVYFDIKDKHEMRKVLKTRECLITKNQYNPKHIDFQLIHSFESQLIQMADILIGAVGYKTRKISTSTAKKAIIETLENGLNKDISQTTTLGFQKFNILRWTPSKVDTR